MAPNLVDPLLLTPIPTTPRDANFPGPVVAPSVLDRLINTGQPVRMDGPGATRRTAPMHDDRDERVVPRFFLRELALTERGRGWLMLQVTSSAASTLAG